MRIAIMAITVSNSISVKPRALHLCVCRFMHIVRFDLTFYLLSIRIYYNIVAFYATKKWLLPKNFFSEVNFFVYKGLSSTTRCKGLTKSRFGFLSEQQ